MRAGLRRWWWLWLLAIALPLQAGEVRLSDEPSFNLARALDYLEDPRGELTLDEVLLPAQQARFGPLPPIGPGPNFGLTRSAYWLKVTLDVPHGLPREWLLEVGYATLDRVDVYAPHAFGYARQAGGDGLPFSARVVAHRNHVFPVSFIPGARTTLYLRVQSDGTLSAPMRLWQPAALWQQDQVSYATLSLYFGLLLGLLVYNLLLFLSVRDIGYLIYAAFAAAMGVAQAAMSGLGAQFLWPEWPAWTAVSVPVGQATSAMLGLMFARSFLATRARMPRLDKLLLAQMAGWGLALLASLFLHYHVAGYMVAMLSVMGVVTLAAIGYLSIRRGYAGARYFFTAWALLLLGVVTLSMHNLGFLPSNALTSNSLLIGSALEMVLLSFALGDRINVARRFKELAQARIAAEQAMVHALSNSQAHLKQVLGEREAILNNAVVGIVLSVNRRHEWVNEKFAQMLGYPAQVLIGQSSMHIHPDEASWLRFGDEARAALIATNGYTCERQLKRRDGELFWVEMGGSCIRPHEPDSGVIWTFLDITARKKSEAEIREALEQQKALNELRTRFVAMTSHEFRTPLAAILSAEEVLRHYGDRLPQAERIETLDSIADGVQRMSRMMDRVMLLGKADAGMLDFVPGQVDLRALCRQLVEEARRQHPQSRCKVAARWGAGVGRGLYDEKLLRHIFGNLLSNAVKYSPGGGDVDLHVRREAGEMVFEVIDQGIGIPPDEIQHLFGSFHRASNVGQIQGTGLGLAIVKNAVEMHGGRIEVASELGKGSRFTVRLPLQAEVVPA
ncbi:PAS domain S-box protein [Ramlibacter henchirensis]|uniref:histidine kinase n=1 Tax=Ramlibacter henchirensis TaxID=204072 RepID=A0A4Z0BJA2_9BURK|nr:7TM diverse intracellular signaling domain-containing protein [Ramlibacter henchirensis]TFY99376.1 PAS domain S-box protein [Ramlibacter henchirensis]